MVANSTAASSVAVVRLSDGTLLNRFWDDRAEPRDESYREAIETALEHRRDPADIYRNIRAATESGWDFSSRWLADGHNLSSIRTVSLLPVDLNCLMAHLERTLAKAYRIAGQADQSTRFLEVANRRETAIRQIMWSERSRMFADYDWEKSEIVAQLTSAGLFPLFFHLATERQAKMIAQTVRDRLLLPGGVVTTLVSSGQQWDHPNGWAPLQWVTVIGLRNYNEPQLAETIARRWSCENVDNYQAFGTLLEKYDLVHDAPGGGGEYPLQIGFGWTNGVFRAFSSLYGSGVQHFAGDQARSSDEVPHEMWSRMRTTSLSTTRALYHERRVGPRGNEGRDSHDRWSSVKNVSER